jgi:hypothetical protein
LCPDGLRIRLDRSYLLFLERKFESLQFFLRDFNRLHLLQPISFIWQLSDVRARLELVGLWGMLFLRSSATEAEED